MEGLGYIIREEHIRTAMEKANAGELPLLQRFLELVGELDRLERTLKDRVERALADAGISKPTLSKPAREAVSQSHDAHREIDRLLTRRCNRAESSIGVVKEVLATAKSDMKEANVHDNWIPEDDPTKAIYSELYVKKRRFVEATREFIAAYE